MEKITSFIRKYRKKVWFSILLNAAAWVFLFLVLEPAFESNDEITLAYFLNRARPIQDVRTLFENYLLGVMTAALYRVTVMVPWYTLFQYGALFVSFSAVTYVLMNRLKGTAAFTAFGMLYAFFGCETVITLSFTKTAGMAAGAGAMLILESMQHEKVKKTGIIFGSLIILMGSMFRFQEALAVGGAISFAGIYVLLRAGKEGYLGRTAWKRILNFVLCLVPVAVLLTGAKAIDHYEIQSSPDSKYYLDYCRVRARLMDHGFPDYAANKETFEHLGINENAWKLYRGWNFYDPDKFDLDTMKELVKLQEHRKLGLQLIKDFFKLYPERFFKNQMFLMYLFVLVLVILYGKRNLTAWFAVILNILLTYGMIFYLFWDGRNDVNRVEVGIWWGSILGLLLLIDPEKFHPDRKTAVVIAMAALIFDQQKWRVHYRSDSERVINSRIGQQNAVSALSNDTDHLYVCQSGAYLLDTAYGPLDLVPIGAASNMIMLGGWSAEGPAFRAVLRNYGVVNPYKEIAGSSVIRLIAKDPSTILTYIHDYYDPEATAEVVGNAAGLNIYEIHE